MKTKKTFFLCPVCNKYHNEVHFSCFSGSLGGRAKGARKRRSKAFYRRIGRLGGLAK